MSASTEMRPFARLKVLSIWATPLARVVPFDLELLRSRYEDEMKPDLGNPERESLTLQLWN